MGGGHYSYEEHEEATRARAALGSREVFTQGSCHPEMDPRGVKVRECRDSEAHPESRGIVFALDVSGSMGEIPVTLAMKNLPSFMKAVMTVLRDPQVMFMAFGSVYESRSPLQVGQFESEDKLIDKWLSAIHLEGGGEWRGESYDLAMHFAARHTALDCWEKRGKKGYFFMTGDEVWFVRMDKDHLKRLLGDDLPDHLGIDAVADLVAERYHPFFLIPDPERARNDGVEAVWRRLLGDCTIVLSTPDDTAVVAALLVGIREGLLPDAAAITAKLTGELGYQPQMVDRVLKAVLPYAEAVARGGGDPPTERPPIVEMAAKKQPG